MAPQPSSPVRSLEEFAEEQLRFIRATMERAASFTAVSGRANVLLGVSAGLAAWLAAHQATHLAWLLVWLAEALFGVTLSILAMRHRARAQHLSLFNAVGRRFFLGLLPPLAAGAVISAALIFHGFWHLLVPVWLLLYGTGVVTAGIFSIRLIPAMGFCFMAAGAAAFFLPWQWHNAAMAVGFGGFHILFGILIERRTHG